MADASAKGSTRNERRARLPSYRAISLPKKDDKRRVADDVHGNYALYVVARHNDGFFTP